MFRKGDIVEFDRVRYVVTNVNKNGSLSVNYAAGSGKKGFGGSITAKEANRVRKIVPAVDREVFKKIDEEFFNNMIDYVEYDAYSRSFYDEQAEREDSRNVVDNYVFFPSYHQTVGIWGVKKSTMDGKISGFYKLGYKTREEAFKAASQIPDMILHYPHNVENNEIIMQAAADQLVSTLPTNDPDGPWHITITYKNIISDHYDYPHLTDGWQLYVYNYKKNILFNDYETYDMVRPLTFKQALRVKEHVVNLASVNTVDGERYMIDREGVKHLRHQDEPFPTGAIKHSPWNPHDTVF